MAPTLANGKICYLELPAVDASQSAAFYAQVFGWRMRTRGDGARAFDDTTGEVSGAFVPGRKASPTPGLLFYIMVDSVADACRAVEAHGGTVVQPPGADAPRDHGTLPRSRRQHRRLVPAALARRTRIVSPGIPFWDPRCSIPGTVCVVGLVFGHYQTGKLRANRCRSHRAVALGSCRSLGGLT